MKSHMGKHDLNVLVIPLSSFKADVQQVLTGVVASLLGIELDRTAPSTLSASPPRPCPETGPSPRPP